MASGFLAFAIAAWYAAAVFVWIGPRAGACGLPTCELGWFEDCAHGSEHAANIRENARIVVVTFIAEFPEFDATASVLPGNSAGLAARDSVAQRVSAGLPLRLLWLPAMRSLRSPPLCSAQSPPHAPARHRHHLAYPEFFPGKCATRQSL